MSYTGVDRVWAEWIAWQLEEAGYRVVIQAWDFRPGSDFVVNMRDAAGSERTIAVLSPAYVSSAFGVAEWAAAFAADPTGGDQKLVPVRVAEFAVEGLDRPRVFIDLVGADEAGARERLLDGVHLGRAKPAVAPRFPSAHAVAVAPRFPGALPAVWNVPHHHNPNFTGRGEILDSLAVAVALGGVAVPWAIVGLGGIGKSQLVAEYAYRHSEDFDVVWWVRADETATALRDFAALGPMLGLGEEADLAVAAAAVRTCLEGRDRWLVVADNASAVDAVAAWIPRGGGGQVLITSRGGDWAAVARIVNLEVLSGDEALELLGRRSDDSDMISAAAVAEGLGCLPLALEQAAAFVAATAGMGWAGYLGLFESRAAQLLARGRPHGYPATVATTWSLAFDAVERQSPMAAALLRACSFLDPDAIPLSLVAAGGLPEPLDAVGDPLDVADALAVLGRYSLVRGTSIDAIGVHRLVQRVIRDRLGAEGRSRWAAAVVAVMASAFPDDTSDVGNWERCSLLLPHALAAAGHAEAGGVEPTATSGLLDRAGTYVSERGQVAEAKALLDRALAIAEVTYGPDHPTVGSSVSNLAGVLGDLGDYDGARRGFERALAITVAAYGPDHLDVGTILNNLAAVLRDLGDFAGAHQRFERALAIAVAAHGPDHPTVAICLSNLAVVLQDLGDYNVARQHLERALMIDEATYGPDHPAVGTRLNNLALVLRDLGDSKGAHQRFERALAIAVAAHGPDHPNVGTCRNNLALVLQDLGDNDGARQHLERALMIDEATYGPDHPAVGVDLSNLALVLLSLGDNKGARQRLERSLTIAEATHGPDHHYAVNIRTLLDGLP